RSRPLPFPDRGSTSALTAVFPPLFYPSSSVICLWCRSQPSDGQYDLDEPYPVSSQSVFRRCFSAPAQTSVFLFFLLFYGPSPALLFLLQPLSWLFSRNGPDCGTFSFSAYLLR